MNKNNRIRINNAQLAIQNSEAILIGALNGLGNAYQRAGKSQEAISVYERALAIIKDSKLAADQEASISYGLGRAYHAQNDPVRASFRQSDAHFFDDETGSRASDIAEPVLNAVDS